MPRYQRKDQKEVELRSVDFANSGQLPMEHTVWLTTFLSACVYEGVGFYVGKFNMIGGCKVTFYLDDEKVVDFINKQDNPEERVKVWCDHMFGTQIWNEVRAAVAQRLSRSAAKTSDAKS